ncbi:MAG TPA: TonB family protein [Gemmatimonadaceae bacterium]|nr:TonB family protein [Gemmatimonadaceae bacterium]
MRGQLLESRVRHGGVTGGTLASLALHAGMVSLAVLVTAQARVESARKAPETIRWVQPPLAQAPAVREKTPVQRPPAVSTPAALKPPAALRPPSAIDVVIPAVDPLTVTPIAAVSAQPATPTTGGETNGILSATVVPKPGAIFDASEVERQVALRSRAVPRYPAALQYAGTEGRVIAQFVVDEQGRADLSTFTIVGSAHDLFSRAVRDVLPQLRFTPAEIGGRRVAQLVQMPFDFRISR